MDEVLMGLDGGQVEVYLGLIEAMDAGEAIEMPRGAAEFSARAVEFSGVISHFDGAISDLVDRAIAAIRELLAFERVGGGFFGVEYSESEVKSIREGYYAAVLALSGVRGEASALIGEVARELSRLEAFAGEVGAAYSAFLPYRLAFGERSVVVSEEEGHFRSALAAIEAARGGFCRILSLLEAFGDGVVADFLAESARFADSPSFASFDGEKFFGAARGFVLRCGAVVGEIGK